MLINRTFYASIHHQMFYHDFRNCLVLFKPRIHVSANAYISQVNFKLSVHTRPLRVKDIVINVSPHITRTELLHEERRRPGIFSHVCDIKGRKDLIEHGRTGAQNSKKS